MKFRDKKILATVVLAVATVGACLILFLNRHVAMAIAGYPTDIRMDLSSESSENINNDVAIQSEPIDKSFIQWPAIMPAPTSNYPDYRSLLSIIQKWNPDAADLPTSFEETLQHFDYSNLTERRMAERYRNAELPFKVYNVPNFAKAREKWSNDYLAHELRYTNAHVEKSKSNHFMYWRGNSPGYKRPTDVVHMSFGDWVKVAQQADVTKMKDDSEHLYFMTGAQPGDTSHSFIARDLTEFSTRTDNFFISNVNANKGIQCRFGMRGVIAEAHYDAGRNMVAMIRGRKRYILTPPSACKDLGIISDRRHPSYRHSVIDWSDEAQAKMSNFDRVQAIDTIVNEGEVLYIPSYWFHYIVSLQYSIQCNSRSGSPPNKEGFSDIEECMDMKKSLRGDVNNKFRSS